MTATENHPSPEEDTTRRERRNRILLAVLYRRMLTHRRRRQLASLTSSSRVEEVNRPPIRLLPVQEATERNVLCRFCLDTAHPTNSQFIAPCACTGSAEYVHVACLRTWQLQSNQASNCSVCTTPYSLRPPRLKENLIQRGSLLVFSDDEVSGSYFTKTVILMLNGGQDENPLGVIINKPLRSTTSGEDRRLGGPVCGGRLGVIRHAIAHTMASVDVSTTPGDSSDLRNEQVLGNLHFIYDEDGPALLGDDLLDSTLQLLGRAKTETDSMVIFAGFCSWSRDQLMGELARGSWELVDQAQEADLWPTDNNGNLWQDIMDGNRLIPKEQWFEQLDDIVASEQG